MIEKSHVHLTRRERQIMDAIYQLGEATVSAVLKHMPDPPSYSAVRAMCRLLEEKGHVRHRQDGVRYVYMAVKSREKARQSALARLLKTFFDGSTESAVAALLNMSDPKLTESELERIAKLIEDSR